MQQGGQIQSRCACSNYSDLAACEPLKIVVNRTVTDEISRNRRQNRRNICKRRYAHRNDYPVGKHALSIIEPHLEADWALSNRHYHLVIEVRHEFFLKCQSVSDKGSQWNRAGYVLVWQAFLPAKVGQSELRLRIR